MVKLGELVVKITTQGVSQFKSSLRSAGDAVSKWSIATKAAALAAGAALVQTFRESIREAGRFEATMTGLRTVARNTGRDMGEIQVTIDALTKELGGMANQADVSRAVLKLLGTSLSTDQIRQFVKVIQDGAAAMGEDFATQLELVTRGFKQLNPNVIDNIGINVRMNEIYSETARRLGKTRDALSDVEIEQALLNEILEKGAKFAGTAGEAVNTFQGQSAQLQATLDELQRTLGEALLPALKELNSFVLENKDQFQDIADVIGRKLTAAFAALSGVMKLVDGDFKGFVEEWDRADDLIRGVTTTIDEATGQIVKQKMAISDLNKDVAAENELLAQNKFLTDENTKSINDHTAALVRNNEAARASLRSLSERTGFLSTTAKGGASFTGVGQGRIQAEQNLRAAEKSAIESAYRDSRRRRGLEG